MNSIEDRIRQARNAAGYTTAAAAARALGIEQHTYRHYEAGTRIPPADKIPAIAQRFGIELEWLMTGAGPMVKSESDRVVAIFSAIPDDLKPLATKTLEGFVSEGAIKGLSQADTSPRQSAGDSETEQSPTRWNPPAG